MLLLGVVLVLTLLLGVLLLLTLLLLGVVVVVVVLTLLLLGVVLVVLLLTLPVSLLQSMKTSKSDNDLLILEWRVGADLGYSLNTATTVRTLTGCTLSACIL